MRSYPSGWTTLLAILGFRHRRRKTRRNQKGDRKTGFESLEDRRLLSASAWSSSDYDAETTVAGPAIDDSAPVQITREFVVLESEASQYFDVTTAIDAEGQPRALISIKASAIIPATVKHELTLELRLNNYPLTRYQVSIILPGEQFLDEFRDDRLAKTLSRLPPDPAELDPELVAILTPHGSISDLLNESATADTLTDYAATALRRASSLAGDAATKEGVLSGEERRVLYASVEHAVDDLALLETSERSVVAASATALNGNAAELVDSSGSNDWIGGGESQEVAEPLLLNDAHREVLRAELGKSAILLADQIKSDLGSADPLVAAAATRLRDKLVANAKFSDLLWQGYGVNSQVFEHATAAATTLYSTIYESGQLTIAGGLTVDFGRAAVIDVVKTTNGTSSASWAANMGVSAGTGTALSNADGSIYTVNGQSPSSDFWTSTVIPVADKLVSSTSYTYDGVFRFDVSQFSQYPTNAVVTLHPADFSQTPNSTTLTQAAAYTPFDNWSEGTSPSWDSFPSRSASAPVLTVGGQSTWTVASDGQGGYEPIELDVTQFVRWKTRQGDMDLSGSRSISADLTAFESAVKNRAAYDVEFGRKFSDATDVLDRGDANRDGQINASDGAAFLAIHGHLPGDANLNGYVEGSDFLTWQSGTGSAGAFTQGNFDFSGIVDSDDLALWAANMGQTAPSPAQEQISLRLYAVDDAPVLNRVVGYGTRENTAGNAPVLAVAQAPDVVLTHFDTTSSGQLRVAYNVLNANAPNATLSSLEVKIYRSTDGVTPSQLLMTHPVSGASLGNGLEHSTVFDPIFSSATFGENDRLVAVLVPTWTAGADSVANNSRIFSGGVFKDLGALFVLGGDGDDLFEISQSGANYVVNGVSYATAGVTTIQTRTYGGNDRVLANGAALPSMNVYAGAGDDIVVGGSGVDHIFGGAGHDILLAGGGADTLNWGNGTGIKDSILVTNPADENELTGGVFTSVFGVGDLSLREALKVASLSPNDDTIEFASSGTGAMLLGAAGQLLIDSNVTITGPGASVVSIDAHGASRVLEVWPNVTASISGLTFKGGGGVQHGGGIFNSGDLTLNRVAVVNNQATVTGGGIRSANSSSVASLHLIDSTVDGNHAPVGSGLAVYVHDGALEVTGSTISNNGPLGGLADSEAGGLRLQATSGTATIRNSTFSGNSAYYGGGVMVKNSTVPITLANVTIAENTSHEGAGLFLSYSSTNVTAHNSILAANHVTINPWAADAWGTLNAASSYNLFGAGNGVTDLSAPALHNQIGLWTAPTDPKLAPLGDYGGPTKTHALKPTSPAIDQGTDSQASGLLGDQRGQSAAIDIETINDGADGPTDIGAFEYHPELVVTTVADADVLPGKISLRQAIKLETTFTGSGVITFAPAVSGQITLSQGQLLLTSSVTITGPGASVVSIDAHGASRVLEVWPNVTASISGLTFKGGGGVQHGGGIFNSGDLTLNRVAVVNNQATVTGGGIRSANSSSVASLHLIDSTVDGNHAPVGSGLAVYVHDGALEVTGSTISNNGPLGGLADSEAGGLRLQATSGTATIRNSTFSGNSAYYGGGVMVKNSTVPITLANVTIAENTSHEGAGLFLSYSSTNVTAHNSILAANHVTINPWAADAWGTLNAASSYNLFGAGNGVTDLSAPALHNQIGLWTAPTDPKLAPLGDYGGPTKTHALKPTSPAIDQGSNGVTQAAGLTVDQRGFPRSIFDMGAFESNGTADTVSFIFEPNGTLSIGNDLSLLAEVVVGVIYVGQNQLVAINGVNTWISSRDVNAIAIYGGDAAERLDLSQVTVTSFPNLHGTILVQGMGGNDVIYGSEFADVIDAGGGDDVVYAGSGADEVYGAAGVDIIFGGADEDQVSGGGDNDILYGGQGADTLAGDGGDDELYGDEDGDSLTGNDGRDRLDGGAGENSLDGGGDDDVYMIVRDGAMVGGNWIGRGDSIYDVDGFDTIDFSGWSGTNEGVTIDLDSDAVNYLDDTLTNFVFFAGGTRLKNIFGSAYDDHLTGNSANNRIEAGAGDDLLEGNGGDDILLGEAGDDTLFGDQGSDTLFGGPGNDELTGGPNEGVDRIYGDDGNDQYFASPGAQLTTFLEGAGDDEYLFGAGALGQVLLEAESETGASGIDALNFAGAPAVNLSLENDGLQTVIAGGLALQIAGMAHVHGAVDVENVFGSSFNDTIIGDSRNNVLRGGAGNDKLDGNGGIDILLGEAGFDLPEARDEAIIDEASFQQSGIWTASSAGGFNGAQKFAAGSAGSTAAVAWLFDNLEVGAKYEVYATWTPDPQDLAAATGPFVGATNASYAVAGATSADVTVNQSRAPLGSVGYGATWQRLGDVFQADGSGGIYVALTNHANGRVYADAIRLVKVNLAPVFGTLGDIQVNSGTNLDYAITATDTDGPSTSLSFSFVGGVPTGLTIVPNGAGGARLLWPAANRPTGQFPVTVLVEDGGNPVKSTSKTIAITSGSLATGPSDFSVGAETEFEVNELSTLMLDLSATGSGLIYSVGPDAPAGAGFFDPLHPNRFSWTPSEQQGSSAPYTFTLRVTQPGNPPLRLVQTITVKVNETNSVPTLGPVSLVYDTYAPNTSSGSTDRHTINPTIHGLVSNDGAVEDIQVLLDYGYTVGGSFIADATASVTAADGATTQGSFTFEPPASAFELNPQTGNFELKVGVSLREWQPNPAGGGFDAPPTSVATLTLIRDLTADTPPVLEVTLRNNSGTTQAPAGADPTLIGTVQNVDGPVGELTVKMYDEDPALNPSAEPIDEIRTDEAGNFVWTQPGLEALAASGPYQSTLWVTAQEETAFGVFTSAVETLSFSFSLNQPPNIASLSLLQDTGASSNDGVTSNATVVGSIAHVDGQLGGIAVEFDDNNDGTVDGVAYTDDDGHFTYVASYFPNSGPNWLNARAVEWDDYRESRLQSTWLPTSAASGATALPLTFVAIENAAPKVYSFQPLYSNGGGQLADPTVWGQVTNDNGSERVVVEIWKKGASPAQDVLLGVVAPDTTGRFEFTPAGLKAGVVHTLEARAVEWDPLRPSNDQRLADVSASAVKSTSFTLSAVPLAASAFTGISLAFNTGVSSADAITSDPTVRGTVVYAGDYSKLVVEFDHNGDGLVDGTTVPAATGEFSYTPDGLANGSTIVLRGRVRVPDYALRDDDLDHDALLTEGWYHADWDPGNNAWNTSTVDGTDAWFETIFNAAGDGFSGAWYNSSFQRDWSTLFADATTAWSMTTFTLNSTHNLAAAVPSISLTHVSSPHLDPTIHGSVTNDGNRVGLVVEFYLNGSTTPDGSSVTDVAGNFEYLLRNHVLGANSVIAKVIEPRYSGGSPVVGLSGPYTVTLDANPALSVAEFALRDGVWNGTQYESVDPTVRGVVDVPGEAGALLVQFDYNGDGLPDGFTRTDGLGRFEFTPEGLTVDSNLTTVRAQVVQEVADVAGEVRYRTLSAWSSLTWRVLTTPAPQVVQLELKRDTRETFHGATWGSGIQAVDRVTSDPTIVGRIVDGGAYAKIEFDHNDDGIVDGWSTADEEGRFEYTPAGLTQGSWNIRAKVEKYNPVSKATLSSGWAVITATGVPSESSIFTGFILVSPAAATSVTLVHEGLVDGLGETTDPSLSGVVTDPAGTDGLTVDIYRILPGNVRVLADSAPVAANGRFRLIPTGLPFGNLTLVAEVRKHDSTGGSDVVTSSATETLTFVALNSQVGSVNLAQSAEPFNAELVGEILTTAMVQPQYVEIDLNNDGVGDAVAPIGVTGSSYTFRYTPQLASSPTAVTIQARVVVWDSRTPGSEKYATTEWTSYGLSYYLGEPTLSLTEPDADSPAPALTGTVNSPYLGLKVAAAPLVEFDLDGDGDADDSVSASGNAFSYPLEKVAFGAIELRVRATRYVAISDAVAGTSRTVAVPGDWQVVTFDLNDPAPQIDVVELANPTGGATSSQTTNPSIRGQVESLVGGRVDGLTIEIDRDGDGVADQTTTTRLDGSFECLPQNLKAGDVTLRVRAIDTLAPSGKGTGPWTSLNFELIAFLPEIEDLVLLHDEDPGAGVESTDPTLIGSVTRHASVTSLTIEFDYNDDSVADGSTTADVTGAFSFRPTGLFYGNNVIRARVIARSATGEVSSEWGNDLAFFHRSVANPVVSSVAVLDASTGIVTGRLTVDGLGRQGIVEIAVVGSDNVRTTNGFATTDANGYFSYTPIDLRTGDVQFDVRAKVYETTTSVEGGWQSLQEFTYAPGAAPTGPIAVPEFRLAYDTGLSSTDGVTADSTIVGRVAVASPLVTVQFSHNNGATVAAVASVGNDGSFVYRPADLADGTSASIRVRTRIWNPATGGETFGSWTNVSPVSFTFLRSAQASAWVTEFAAQGFAASAVTPSITSPVFVGKVANDGPLAGLIVRFDHDGDGHFEGSAITRDDGSFQYRAAGLSPSATPQTMRAVVVEQDDLGIERDPGPSGDLTFVLQSAPLITAISYHVASLTEGHKVVGTAQTVTTLDRRIEYVVFGNGLSSAPPTSLVNFSPSSATQSVAIATNDSFIVDLAPFDLGYGPATIVARVVVGTGASQLYGAWERLQFQVVPATATALEIPDFELVEDTGLYQYDGQTSNPKATGQVGSGGAGAYAVVEIEVRDLSSFPSPEPRKYRVTADASGQFSLTPPGLAIGTHYEYRARHVVYDPANATESFGDVKYFGMTLLNNSAATILDYELKNPATPQLDPTVKGRVEDDGRLAGIRVEFDVNNDGEADGFTYTDAAGNFEYTPYNIVANQQTTVRARVVEWNGATQQYESGDFAQAETPFTLAQPGPTDPTLDDDFAADEGAVDHADAGAKDGITSLADDLGYGANGALNVGVGTVQVMQRADADSLSSDGQSAGPTFVLRQGSLPQATSVSISDVPISGFATAQGASMGGTHDYEYTVTYSGNTIHVHVEYVVRFGDYHDVDSFLGNAAGSDSLQSTELDISGVYTFIYDAIVIYSGSTIVSGSHDLTETLTYDYLRTSNSSYSAGDEAGTDPTTFTQTTTGDYDYSYHEQKSTSGFNASGSTQSFDSHEVVRNESWYSSGGSSTTGANGSLSTRTYSNNDHTNYARTTDNVGVITVAAGVQTVAGTLTVDSSGSRTTNASENTTYVSQFQGLSRESGTFGRTNSTYFAGNYHGVNAYVTGQSSSINFTYADGGTSSASETGTGGSTSVNESNSINENWNYVVGATVVTGYNASGTSRSDYSHAEPSREFSFSVSATSTIDGGSSGNGTVTYTREGETGTSSGQVSFSASANATQNGSVTGRDDLVAATMAGSMSYSGDYDLTSSGTLSVTTDALKSRSQSESRVSVAISGSGAYQTQGSGSATSATGSYSHSSSISSLFAGQSTGAQTVQLSSGTVEVPYRYNEVSQSSLAVDGTGVFSSSQSPLGSSSTTVGGFSRHSTGSSRSSSFSGIADEGVTGQTTSKQQGSYTSFTGGIITASGGEVQMSGTFANSSDGSFDSQTSIAGSEVYGGTTVQFSSKVETGGNSTDTGSGIFQESSSGRSETGVGSGTGASYSASSSQSSTNTVDAYGSSSSSGSTSSKSKSSFSGNHVYQSENGRIVSDFGRSSLLTTSRGSNEGSSFSSSAFSDGGTFSHSSTGGQSSSGSENESSSTETFRQTGDVIVRTANVRSSYSQRNYGSGFTATTSGEVGAYWGNASSNVTSGSSRGTSAGSITGVVSTDATGVSSQYQIRDQVGGSYSSRTTSEDVSYAPGNTSGSTSVVASWGSGRSSFDGSSENTPTSFRRTGDVRDSSSSRSDVSGSSYSFTQVLGGFASTTDRSRMSSSGGTSYAGQVDESQDGSSVSGETEWKQDETTSGETTTRTYSSSLTGFIRSTTVNGSDRRSRSSGSSQADVQNGVTVSAVGTSSSDVRQMIFEEIGSQQREDYGTSINRVDRATRTVKIITDNQTDGEGEYAEASVQTVESTDLTYGVYPSGDKWSILNAVNNSDTTTFTNGGGNVSLSITNNHNSEITSHGDPAFGRGIESYYEFIESGYWIMPTRHIVGGNDITTSDKKHFESDYSSRHNVDDDGLASGGKLMAKSKTRALHTVTGGKDDRTERESGSSEKSSKIDYSSGSTTTEDETGSYWDERTSTGGVQRRASGSGRERSTSFEKFTGSGKDTEKEWFDGELTRHDTVEITTQFRATTARTVETSYSPSGMTTEVTEDSNTSSGEGRTERLSGSTTEVTSDRYRYTTESGVTSGHYWHEYHLTNPNAPENDLHNPPEPIEWAPYVIPYDGDINYTPLEDDPNRPVTTAAGDAGDVPYVIEQIPVVNGPPKRDFGAEYMRPAYEHGALEDVPIRAGFSPREIDQEHLDGLKFENLVPSVDTIQTGLDAAGMVDSPMGTVADVANAALYAARGEGQKAAWSLAFSLPVVGGIIHYLKGVKGAGNAVREVVEEAVDEAVQQGVRRADDAADGARLGRPQVAGTGTAVQELIELHHNLPQSKQLKPFFERVGLDIEQYTEEFLRSRHRLKPDGLHTGSQNWNKLWKEFFKTNPRADKTEILNELDRIRGIHGLPPWTER